MRVIAGKYAKYKPEFRDEVAKLVVDSNRSIVEVAREYGLNETTVGGWGNTCLVLIDDPVDGSSDVSGAGQPRTWPRLPTPTAGEREIGRSPALAAERTRKRNGLLTAAEALLARIVERIERIERHPDRHLTFHRRPRQLRTRKHMLGVILIGVVSNSVTQA